LLSVKITTVVGIWILLSVLAAFLWTLVGFVDQYITKEKVPRMGHYYVYSAAGAATLVIGITLWQGIWLPSITETVLIFFSGGAFSLMLWFYLQALKIEDTSYVVPLFQIAPVWSAGLAFLALNEVLVGNDLIAFIIILLGGLILSLKKDVGQFFSLKPALAYMLAATLLVSVKFVAFKYFLQIYPEHFWHLFALQSLGEVVFGLFLAWWGWPKNDSQNFGNNFLKIFPLFWANDMVSFLAFVCYLWAISLASVALVGAISGIQGFFTFILGIILTLWWPNFIKENITKPIIIQKIVGIGILLFGVVWLQL